MKKSIIFRFLALAVAAVIGVCAFAGCSNGKTTPNGKETTPNSSNNESNGETVDSNAVHTKVKFEIEISGKDAGSFVMELYPEYAPITVENFISLVEDGFYDGLIFHRIAEGGYGPFVAQGGDPKGNGTGGSKSIKGEFAANGVNNPLSHTRGVVSMARRGDSYDSGSCQFFICYNDYYTSALDGQYAAFGKVIEGMEVVDSFLEIERDSRDKPLTDIVIASAYIVE